MRIITGKVPKVTEHFANYCVSVYESEDVPDILDYVVAKRGIPAEAVLHKRPGPWDSTEYTWIWYEVEL